MRNANGPSSRNPKRPTRRKPHIGDDILKITRDEGIIGVRPEGGLKNLLQRSSTVDSPGGTQGPGVMGPYWTDTKRVIPGELHTLHKPTGDGVPGCSSMRSSSGDKEITGRAKFKSTTLEL